MVNGVHDVVNRSELVEQSIGFSFIQTFVERDDVDLGINVMDAFFCDFAFETSEGAFKGEKLPVHVACCNTVVVKQDERSDARARERFHGPGTDTAQPRDEYRRLAQAFERAFGVQ